MKKYFYTDGIEKIGPFSFEELKKLNLTRETNIWFYGLENWTMLSKIEELQSITKTIPPTLKTNEPRKVPQEVKIAATEPSDHRTPQNKSNNKRKSIRIVTITVVVLLTIVVAFIIDNNQKSHRIHHSISSSAYETEVDFDFYLKKFYRDIEFYGISFKKPKITIIKFAKLDQLSNTLDIHGMSYGINDDDKIEIYINPSSWENFNKPMRYFLMYHELSHDVLNVDDLKALPSNEGKLMYPELSNFESKTMDDFIESSHELFEQVASNQK